MFDRTEPDLKLRLLWLAIGYALIMLVLFLSLTSSPIDPGLDIVDIDKLYHAFAYFTLMFWFGQIYHDKFKRNLIAVLFVLMGVSLEYLQSLNPARMSEFADMIANTTGVLIGLLLVIGNAKNVLLKLESYFR